MHTHGKGNGSKERSEEAKEDRKEVTEKAHLLVRLRFVVFRGAL